MNLSPLSVSRQLLTALRAAVVFLVLCGLVYTGSVTLLGAALFPHQATGSLVKRGDQWVGSALIAQPFASPGYFYGRPSACGYDPMATAGSNLAPGNPALRDRVAAESRRIQALEQVEAQQIPVDLLATSGGGLDPHVSPEAALLQAPRIASVRQLPLAQVQALIMEHTEGPQWGLFGQTRVNVLLLNLALDQRTPDWRPQPSL